MSSRHLRCQKGGLEKGLGVKLGLTLGRLQSAISVGALSRMSVPGADSAPERFLLSGCLATQQRMMSHTTSFGASVLMALGSLWKPLRNNIGKLTLFTKAARSHAKGLLNSEESKESSTKSKNPS